MSATISENVEKQALGEDVENTSSASPEGSNKNANTQTSENANIVDWDGPNDPHNPLNWSPLHKWIIIALTSANTFVVSFAPTVFAPGVPLMMKEFHSTSSSLASLSVSIYIIGLIIGPVFLAPLSELYGRSPIIHVSNVLFLIFSIACAVSSDLAMFIVFRLFTGIAGSTPVTLGGGIIADLMPPEKRGTAMIAWLLGPLLGPVIGPVAGGFLAQGEGWRWIARLVVICSGVVTTLSFILYRETYGTAILSHKAARLRKETGNLDLKSKFDKGQSPSQLFRTAIIRPTKLLLGSPIVALLAVYTSIVYSYMYLLFTTFTRVFENQYNFNTGEAGLAYLGLGIGFFLGQIGVAIFDAKSKKRVLSSGKAMTPEDRLPPLKIGTFLIPVGLVIYGWSADKHVHWIVPIIGTLFIGIGILFVFFPIQMYLVDAFTIYAASALATNTVVRSLFGATIPLAGPKLYASLGLGWGNSLLAFIALAFSPSPFLLIKYGERIRTHPSFQPKL
ncbi:Efflux pump radE [Lachnellula arida]|uniref:Efflux pump radE n=1 Tax=Lachnellula arida TaxID=1316785 RepID=A0A8T9BAD7_9HELO|nr:Efflux pump radE [Lachnellula arida]